MCYVSIRQQNAVIKMVLDVSDKRIVGIFTILCLNRYLQKVFLVKIPAVVHDSFCLYKIHNHVVFVFTVSTGQLSAKEARKFLIRYLVSF